jgi:hypothetical protein
MTMRSALSKQRLTVRSRSVRSSIVRPNVKEREQIMMRLKSVGLIAGVVGLVMCLAPLSASALTGTAEITGGSLNFSEPASPTFTATLGGSENQKPTATQEFTVQDERGTGAGWNITGTSTQFTTGGATPSTLPATATTFATPTITCSTESTCTKAVTEGIAYSVTLPAGVIAPTALKLVNAKAETGLGSQVVKSVVTLTVPQSSKVGKYTSTWTYSLTSGP